MRHNIALADILFFNMGTVEYFDSILHAPSCTSKYTRTKVNVFKITTQQMHYSSPNK